MYGQKPSTRAARAAAAAPMIDPPGFLPFHRVAPQPHSTGGKRGERERRKRQPTALCVLQSWRLGLLVVIALTLANHAARTLGPAADLSAAVVVVSEKAAGTGKSTEEPRRRDAEQKAAASPAAKAEANGNNSTEPREHSERADVVTNKTEPKNSTEHTPQQQRTEQQAVAVPVPAAAAAAATGSHLPFRIIQVSRHHTGSTMMSNLLTGLFEPDPDADTCYLGLHVRLNYPEKPDPCPDRHVVKTHNMNVLRLIWWFRQHFSDEARAKNGGTFGGDVLVVSTSRGNVTIGEEYCGEGGRYGRNVLCFEYDDILYSDDAGMQNVVHHVTETLRSKFPRFADTVFDEAAAVGRLREMDRVQREMADRPFDEQNEKFLIHGGHRNRKNNHRKLVN